MKKDITANSEISEICTFTLGGYNQKVLIEGKKKELPIVITLHGGPGTPIPFSVGCRGLFPMFTDHFIMIYWDQLGCGINNHLIDHTFSIETFVQMTEELIHHIQMKFPGNKMMLFATSWGSILSAKVLEKNPHIVDAVVVCGQIIKDVFLGDEVIETLSRSSISSKRLEQIKHITKGNITSKELRLISGCLRKYTNGYQNKAGEKTPVGQIMRGLLRSPDYKLKDLKAMFINGYLKNISLWKEIVSLNLSEALSNVDVPYIMLQGDTDIVASTLLVKELVEKANNSNLSYKVIENTGHLPGREMMEQLLCTLKELV